ncbi:TonB-dependent receptor plug domain-containing protein [Holophaga foetida]|uniref:TonB-dependent receptor plug domain-containing protein n=1 Tax=Holophaga foetida TaxID=35839 RepID=UPI00024732E5|nr:TonB-dependent receptor plug domain-containing protein [Holophaga foetida]
MGQTRIALLLALGASLMAESTAGSFKPKAEASATVSVTAEASPVELVETPNPVTVVTSAKLERIGADNLSDLLQDLFPGQVYRTGAIGATSSFQLGGARSQDVAVTIDGVRVNDPSGTVGTNMSMVNLVGIDRAEIQQGPCSARYGSSAMGGSVALYSAGSPKDGFSGSFRLKGGTAGIVGTTFAPTYGWNSGWVRASVDLQRQDSNLEAANAYRSTGVFLGAGQELGANTLATLSYRNAYIGVPLPIASISKRATDPAAAYDEERGTQSRNEMLSASIQTVFSPTLRGALGLGGYEVNRIEPAMGTGSPSPYHSRSKQATGSLTWDPVSILSTTFAVEATEAQAEIPISAVIYRGEDTHLAASAEAEVKVIPTLRIVGSLRWEHAAQDLPTATLGHREERRSAVYTGKGGVNWILPAGFRVYASAGWGFSNPLLYQSVYNARKAGEALDDEKSKFIQSGLSYESGPWKAQLSLSRTLYASLVYFDTTPYLYYNGQGIRIQSAELSGGYETKAWGLTGFYRNQEARDTSKSEAQQLTSSAVYRRPFQACGLATYWVLGDVRMDGRWSWTGSQYESGFAYRTHFNDLSLSATWAVSQQLSLALRGENLMQPHASKSAWMSRTYDFKNDASQVYGYPAQSPSLTAELRYRF